MLTKEECMEAFDHILFCDRDKPHSYISDAYRHDLNTLHRLIEEHFDNPPLKFEDLKEGMWVWSNLEKKYKKIYEVFRFKGYEEWIGYEDGLCEVCELFEENSLYRYEVKE